MYRIDYNRTMYSESDICELDGEYLSLQSELLTQITGKEISENKIKNTFKNLNVRNKISLDSKFLDAKKDDLSDELGVNVYDIYEKEFYIEEVCCNYKLTYVLDSTPYFGESISFGGLENNNYVNLDNY